MGPLIRLAIVGAGLAVGLLASRRAATRDLERLRGRKPLLKDRRRSPYRHLKPVWDPFE
jgi:hypothetical protein